MEDQDSKHIINKNSTLKKALQKIEENNSRLVLISDLNKKYELNEIVKGDSIFCATGITDTEMVAAIKKENTKFVTETLVTHKESTIEIIESEEPIA